MRIEIADHPPATVQEDQQAEVFAVIGSIQPHRHPIRIEIHRGQEWVSRQLDLWQRAVRVADEAVAQAKTELAGRRFPGFDGRMPDATVQERNLRRAVARLEHCEDQVVKCRKWMTQLPKLIDETFTGASHRLNTFLETDVPGAVAALQRQIEALERYTETRLDFASAPSAASVPAKPPEPSP